MKIVSKESACWPGVRPGTWGEGQGHDLQIPLYPRVWGLGMKEQILEKEPEDGRCREALLSQEEILSFPDQLKGVKGRVLPALG